MTEKQMRYHLSRIWYRWEKLYEAINDAHNQDLIKYPKDANGNWPGETCCRFAWKLRETIEKYTERQIAKIIQQEIRKEI